MTEPNRPKLRKFFVTAEMSAPGQNGTLNGVFELNGLLTFEWIAAVEDSIRTGGQLPLGASVVVTNFIELEA